MGEFQQGGGGALIPSDGSIASEIAIVWSEALGTEAVGGDADFFELGGDSLAAVRMLAALEERLSVQVSFTDFLEGPTVAALAEAVERLRGTPSAAGAEDELIRADDGAPARLSFAQERLWFLEQLGGSTSAYNMPIGARLHGLLDVDALRRALNEVVSRHEALRTTFATEGGQAVAVAAPALEVELELVDLSDADRPESEAQRVLAELASRPFDLERGPLLRAVLLRVAEQEHVLELVFHHIVCDGCSQAVVMREFGISI